MDSTIRSSMCGVIIITIQVAGAGFVITFITVRVEESCLLRFTLAANSGSHTSQFGSCGLILYCSRIRKYVTYRIRKNATYIQRTYREQKDREQRNQLQRPLYCGNRWNAGLSGSIIQ